VAERAKGSAVYICMLCKCDSEGRLGGHEPAALLKAEWPTRPCTIKVFIGRAERSCRRSLRATDFPLLLAAMGWRGIRTTFILARSAGSGSVLSPEVEEYDKRKCSCRGGGFTKPSCYIIKGNFGHNLEGLIEDAINDVSKTHKKSIEKNLLEFCLNVKYILT
jgi:hypothetical protein